MVAKRRRSRQTAMQSSGQSFGPQRKLNKKRGKPLGWVVAALTEKQLLSRTFVLNIKILK